MTEYSSSSDSSSSADNGTLSIAFRVESFTETPIWCFANRLKNSINTIYAGTGPNGTVLKSTDLENWSTFMKVDDSHVLSMIVWANALFSGTKPKGRIYVHNFTSNAEYMFVETEDSEVTAFAEYNGKLFVGTSPSGIVYSFNGTTWKEEHRPYGNGVTAMVVSDDKLIVFSKKSEGPVTFDGSSWEAYFEKEQNTESEENSEQETENTTISVAAIRIAKQGIYDGTSSEQINRENVVIEDINGFSGYQVNQTNPLTPQFNVNTAINKGSGIAFGGIDNGSVLNMQIDGSVKLFDIGLPVHKLLSLTSGAIMVSSGGTLFLATEDTL